MSLELSGPDASRGYIEAAHPSGRPDHPSLLDPEHRMDALFGVVNIPNVVWIDEEGTIVRPPEPGWPGGRQEMPKDMLTSLPEMGRAHGAPVEPEGGPGMWAVLGSGQDRTSYPDAIRDWVAKGADSAFVMSASEVVSASEPRTAALSEGAAHFELANHLWRAGQRDTAIAHFNECHRLQPDNWTYRRQAWSLVGSEQVDSPYGRFVQGPVAGTEDDWPFASDFRSEVSSRAVGSYYPKTL